MLQFFLGYHKYCSASGMFVQEHIDSFDAAYRRAVWNFMSCLKKSEDLIMSTLYITVTSSTPGADPRVGDGGYSIAPSP